MLEKLFGTNWRTSISGIIAGLCAFLAFYPEALEPLPDYWEKLAKQIIAFAISAGLIQLGRSSRDNVNSNRTVEKLQAEIESKADKVEIEKIKNEKF